MIVEGKKYTGYADYYSAPGGGIVNSFVSPEVQHARFWLPQDGTNWQSLDLVRPRYYLEHLDKVEVEPTEIQVSQLARAAFVLCDLDGPDNRVIFETIEPDQPYILGRQDKLPALRSGCLNDQHAFLKIEDDWLQVHITEAALEQPIGLEALAPKQSGLILEASGKERLEVHPYYKPPVPIEINDPIPEKGPSRRFGVLVGSITRAAALGLMLKR